MPKPDLRAVSSELPDPPYPADTRAKGMGLNLKTQDVRNTKAWRLAPPELKSCLLRLWFESWDSVPAGTLDDDDELIASQIEMPLAQFQIHKEALMRGWVRHSDGLLYHPVMTERTLDVIAWRGKNAEKQRRFRKKKQPEDVASKSPVSNRLLTGQSPGSNLPSTSTSPSPSPSPGSSKEKKAANTQATMQSNTPKPVNGSAYSLQDSNGKTTETKRAQPLPSGIDQQAWSDFEQHRKDIKKPLSDMARTKAANQLKSLTAQQQRDCVDKTVMSRWTGLFPDNPKGHRIENQPTAARSRAL